MVIVVQWMRPSLGTGHCIRQIAAEKTHLSEGKWSNSGLISSRIQTRLNADYKVYICGRKHLRLVSLIAVLKVLMPSWVMALVNVIAVHPILLGIYLLSIMS